MEQGLAQETPDAQDVYYKSLPQVRKMLLNEFRLKAPAAAEVSSQLGQEPYNMVKDRDGERRPSTQWKITLEGLWALNNAPVVKGRRTFDKHLRYTGVNFSRRDIYSEVIFRADLIALVRGELRKLGYDRVYVNVINKHDWETNKEYQTLLIKIPVGKY